MLGTEGPFARAIKQCSLTLVGCQGGGKTSLALRLGRNLDLPVVHLDPLYWRPGWKGSEDLMIMSALVDEETCREWLYELTGFAVSKAAQHRYGACGEFYDHACAHDDLIIDRVIGIITKSPQQARRYRQETDWRAEGFARRHWAKITQLANEIFKHGRLDRQQIEAVLAPPTVVPRAMPRRAGDEPNFFRRCDGYFR
jgi:hypothetical protein